MSLIYKKKDPVVAQPQPSSRSLSTTSAVWRTIIYFFWAKEVSKKTLGTTRHGTAAKTSNLTLLGHICPLGGTPPMFS